MRHGSRQKVEILISGSHKASDRALGLWLLERRTSKHTSHLLQRSDSPGRHTAQSVTWAVTWDTTCNELALCRAEAADKAGSRLQEADFRQSHLSATYFDLRTLPKQPLRTHADHSPSRGSVNSRCELHTSEICRMLVTHGG